MPVEEPCKVKWRICQAEGAARCGRAGWSANWSQEAVNDVDSVPHTSCESGGAR